MADLAIADARLPTAGGSGTDGEVRRSAPAGPQADSGLAVSAGAVTGGVAIAGGRLPVAVGSGAPVARRGRAAVVVAGLVIADGRLQVVGGSGAPVARRGRAAVVVAGLVNADGRLSAAARGEVGWSGWQWVVGRDVGVGWVAAGGGLAVRAEGALS
ncbi:hypothetical protein [Saccharothrix sp. HUAS TT1]|uniref:hypothetical protein n=1 Tax=unclassified Saccharothrix TaxID=2593673 RepID=UPI00345C096C